ncbi:S41 family peptidase [Chitinophagaceae bacterium 26-R-25]|nr:S41 family peptidase [Chitinophagaceae bacterium 26-R-25]
MKQFSFVFVACILTFQLTAQNPVLEKVATNAFIITRIVDKYHVEPKPVDKTLSYNLFDHVIDALDEERMFFIKEDIEKLQPFRMHLDEELLGRKTAFLQQLSAIYQARVAQVDTMIDNICKKPFNFSVKETLTETEDTSFALNTNLQRIKIAKSIKKMMLNKISLAAENNASLPADRQRKIIDSVELVTRKRVQLKLKLAMKKMLQSPGGIPQVVGDAYCNTLASYFDPHTAYFPLTEKENFESQLGAKPLRFGFQLVEDDNGNVTIGKLLPGSPAFKSGQLNKGDKIVALQWAGKEEIDVSEANREEISEVLDASNHEEVTFTIKKVDGTVRKVVLQKATNENDEADNKVKSFVLKGAKNIGFISLPAFYTDWETNSSEDHGCANDVAKEILKLKKENITGLIIDLRFNGGGSIQEAIELAGIFIDAGPVGQIKSRDAKVYTMMDVNRGTMYDGPLVFLVNGYSASASEILAAAMQDYNRALIVGSPTYGKATAQLIMPMDTVALANHNANNTKADSYLKLTINKLFRVTGQTAQFNGVIPDVKLPDILEIDSRREADEPFALKPSVIPANKYYKPLAPLPVAALQGKANPEIDQSEYFNELKKYAVEYKKVMANQDVSLYLNDVLAARKKVKEKDDAVPKETASSSYYVVSNHSFDEDRFASDEDLKKLNNEWRKALQKDPYIKIAYDLLITGFK